MFKFLLYLLLFYIISRVLFGRISGSSGGFKTRVFRFDTHTHHHHYHKQEEPKEEGRITVNPKINKQGKEGGNAGNIGEYVDYEEVK